MSKCVCKSANYGYHRDDCPEFDNKGNPKISKPIRFSYKTKDLIPFNNYLNKELEKNINDVIPFYFFLNENLELKAMCRASSEIKLFKEVHDYLKLQLNPIINECEKLYNIKIRRVY